MDRASRERGLVTWFREARRQGRLPLSPFLLRPEIQVCEPEWLYADLEAKCAEPPRNAHIRRLWLGRLTDLRGALEQPVRPPPADGVDAYNR